MDKNKVIYGVLVVMICWLGFLSWRSLGNKKIAYVEANVLLPKYEGFKVAQREFQKKASVWKAQSDTLVNGWQNELKAYEKERTKLNSKERELKEQLLGNKQQQISNYRNSLDKKAKEEEEKMMQAVYNEINEFLTQYGKNKGYDFILGANGSGNVLYANEGNNITEIVLEGLNKEYNKRHK